jgi:hypothetical protein
MWAHVVVVMNLMRTGDGSEGKNFELMKRGKRALVKLESRSFGDSELMKKTVNR